jgi:tRNA (adenine22-N1)-methyltransferase
VADTVPSAATSVADVGAGDGLLARHLAARGLRVIATERRTAPFARLVAAAPELDCRLGDGLEVLQPGEVQGAVVAGMGGHSIVRMLGGAREVAASLDWLVLQAQQHTAALQEWLTAAGWRVCSTRVVRQGRHSYTVLLVKQR